MLSVVCTAVCSDEVVFWFGVYEVDLYEDVLKIYIFIKQTRLALRKSISEALHPDIKDSNSETLTNSIGSSCSIDKHPWETCPFLYMCVRWILRIKHLLDIPS